MRSTFPYTFSHLQPSSESGQAAVAPPPTELQPRADEVAQEMDVTTEVAVAGGDELRPAVEKQKEEETENEEKEDGQNEEEPRETHHLLVMARKNERARAKKTRPNSRDLELQRQQKRASRDFREDEFLSQLRRVRLSAPQVKTVNWSNMAMSTYDTHTTHTAHIARFQLTRVVRAECQIGIRTGRPSKRSRCTTTTSPRSR
jgi:hypothetical protein